MFVKLLAFLVFFCFGQFAEASTFYFSSSSGVDTNNFAQAQNPSTPWKTIDKLNSVLKLIQPGDSILFRSGEHFHGTIEIVKSGTIKSSIFFGSYGIGEKPILTGFKELRNWVKIGENLFEESIKEFDTEINIVVADNQIQAMGRFPNPNSANGGYLTISSYKGGILSSPELKSSSSLIGGEIVIRKNNWIIDRHSIISNSYNTIQYDTIKQINFPSFGYGFFIQNKPFTLDFHGEWYFDKKNKKLQIYYKGDPNSGNIKIATINSIINIQNKASNIKFENISFEGCNQNLMNIRGSSNIQIENCNFKYTGQNAINTEFSKNLHIENSIIKNSLNGGIFLGWNDIGFRLKNTTIEEIYNFAGMGRSGEMQGQAIYMSETSSDIIIEGNKFINNGYNAINFSGNNVTIKNNLIDTFCFIKDDGGGIYTFTGNKNNTYKDRTIQGNIIINGIGAVQGTLPFGNKDLPYVEGIYLDQNASGIVIKENTIVNVKSKGIFLNNARNITVTNNKILNTGYALYIKSDNPLIESEKKLIITNNELVVISKGQLHYTVHTANELVGSIGIFNNNIISDPFKNNTKSINIQTPSNNSKIDLNTWRNSFGLDENSTVGPTIDKEIQFSEINLTNKNSPIFFEFNHSNIVKTITLFGTYIDLKGNHQSGTIKIDPYSSIILLKSTN